MEYLHGKMVANIKDNIWMIKNMDLVNFFGQMVECIKDFGKMVDNMVKVFIEVVMVLKEKVNGRMEKKLNGQMNDFYLFFFNFNLFVMSDEEICMENIDNLTEEQL